LAISIYTWHTLGMRSFVSLFILFVFFFNTIGPMPYAQAGELYLPAPGVRVGLSPEYNLTFAIRG